MKRSRSDKIDIDIQKAPNQPSLSNSSVESTSSSGKVQIKPSLTQERNSTPSPEGESMYERTIARQFSKSFACVTPIRKKTNKRAQYEIPKEGTPPQFWDLQFTSSPLH